MRKILRVIIILSLTATQLAYASDGACLRVPVGMPKVRQILAEGQEVIRYLENVSAAADKGECAFRPSAKKTMDAFIRIYKENPNASIEELIKEADIEFDKLSYYEFYSVLLKYDPLQPTKYAENLLKQNPEIFDDNIEDLYQKIRRLLKEIIQIAVIKRLNLSSGEMEMLKECITLRGDTDSERKEKYEKIRKVMESKNPEIIYKVVSKYCDALYKMQLDSVTYMHEIFGREEKFGRGDEHELDNGGLGAFILAKYVDRNKLIPITELSDIGIAGYYILRGQNKKAINIYRKLLSDKNSHSHALSLILGELVWMMENEIPGYGAIIEEFGVDGRCLMELDEIQKVVRLHIEQKYRPIFVGISNNVDAQTGIHIGSDPASGIIINLGRNIRRIREKGFKNELGELRKTYQLVERYASLSGIFGNEDSLLKYAEGPFLLRSKNDDRKNFGREIINNVILRKKIVEVMGELKEYLDIKLKTFERIIAYFEARKNTETSTSAIGNLSPDTTGTCL